MKKSLFGYKKTEVDVLINTLREENDSLNATITTLNTQIKNGEATSAKVNLLESEIESLKGQNAELMKQIENLQNEKEALNKENSELKKQIIDTSFVDNLKEQLNSEKKAREALELELRTQVEELTAATVELDKSYEISEELNKAHKKIQQLEEELKDARQAAEELSQIKIIEKRQVLNQKLASEISLRAYYEMSKMQHEVVDYVHGQIKDYYQCVNENNLKLRADIEQCQLLYNQMIRDFFSKANEFRTALSNMENNYSNMVDYNINTDKLSNRMNEIINNFLNDTNNSIAEKDKELASIDTSKPKAKSHSNPTEASVKKPLVYNIL